MILQNLYTGIISNKRSTRFICHALFWLAVYLYHVVRVGIMMPEINSLRLLGSVLFFAFTRGVIPNIFLTYFIVYYLIPKFFNRKKYTYFIAGLMVAVLLLQTYGALHDGFIRNPFVSMGISGYKQPTWLSYRAGFIRLFGNPPLILGLFLSLKFLKNWHLAQLKTEILAKENTHAELQLLKAQVHPHFLFNTLNNIYSFTLTKSPLASTLVQKLSDMLNYMIHECEKPLVPLKKEIHLIQDYMGLENVRYGHRLKMEIEITGDYENKQIAPLLMIPFVENCFKHGASVMRGQQWIRLTIQINEDRLDLHLSNSRPPQIAEPYTKGIGLANVRKRLKLIYPERHLLEIVSSDDTYYVHLQVELQQLSSTDPINERVPKLQTA